MLKKSGRAISTAVAITMLGGCGGGSDANQDGPVVDYSEVVLDGFTTSTDVLAPNGTSVSAFAANFNLSSTANRPLRYYLLVHVVPEGANLPDPTTPVGLVGKRGLEMNTDGTLTKANPLVLKCTVSPGGLSSTRRGVWCGGTSTDLYFDLGRYDLVAHVCDDYLPDAVQCAPPRRVSVVIR
jgi:hypothetical protein